MSTGLRDQRFAVYSYTTDTVDGIPRSTYTKLPSGSPDGDWWGRAEPAGAREALVAQQAQHEVDWVLTFGEGVPLDTNGIVAEVPNGRVYKITGVYFARMTREYIVHAIEASDEVYTRVVG
jgi:hypothetical protein